MSLLLDLSDERRANKPWLPKSDKDVSEGRVLADFGWDGRPRCFVHGAMNCIAPPADDGHRLYRCQECGVGAVWYPTDSPEAKIRFPPSSDISDRWYPR